jgi:GT2 family glycosyltransferase
MSRRHLQTLAYRARLLLRPLLRRHPRAKRLLAQGFPRIVELAHAPAEVQRDKSYAERLLLHGALTAEDRATIGADIGRMAHRPRISVVMPAYQTPPALLVAAIESVRAQLYPHWELCIADDASPSGQIAATVARYADDPRIRFVRRARNGHISAATNSALALASGEWVALLDHDDLLDEAALYEVAVAIDEHPGVQVIYSDEDKVDDQGRRFAAYFKPDFDPDLLLAQNLVSHLGCYRRDLLLRLGGLREGFEGSQDHDLALRATAACGPRAVHHIPRVLYHWRQQAAGRASFSEAMLERCKAASRRAALDHLAAQGIAGAQVLGSARTVQWNRVVWPVPAPEPLVSIIIPTRDRADLLANCLEGVLHRTDWRNLEVIIVDNGSTEPATEALFARLAAEDGRVRVLSAAGPFNYSSLNNTAARMAGGEVLLLLNNDIQVIERGWLRELVSHALRPEVGAVGARLLYADGRLQHGGVVLGAGGIANHYQAQLDRRDPGYMGLMALTRRVSAVTGACLALRAQVFREVGGLDETHLAVTFNDVDLCLRIRQRGYAIVWTPHAELFHLESASRGLDETPEKRARFAAEEDYMRRRWGPVVAADPYYNPNFSRAAGDFRVLVEPPGPSTWQRRQAAARLVAAGATG